MLLTLSVIVAILGVVLIILGALPVTRPHIPGGVGAGVTLLVVGVLLAVVLKLTGLTV